MSQFADRTDFITGLSQHDRRYMESVLDFAEAHLSSRVRRSGESYARHGQEVALVLREATDDMGLLSVALVHDIFALPDGEMLLQQSPLKSEYRQLAKQMNALRRLHIDASTQDLDYVIDAFIADARLLPLRMAHRLNDVRHLNRFTKTLRTAIAKESLHMYSSIAGRLGLYRWRYEMEDICFRYLQPNLVCRLEKQYASRQQIDDACLEQTEKFLRKTFKKNDVHCRIDARKKAVYSTYRKMIIKNRTFDELTDRLAIRIIVPDVMDCYKALAIVHGAMHPMPGKLKDYIGAPKENGYQSIHTVIYPLPGVTEQPIEMQIRSEAMHELNEYGMLSHGEYKNALYALHAAPGRVDLFQNLERLREDSRSPRQFEEALRKYFSHDRITVFDSESNLHHFKKPLTALDAVASMHPERFALLKTVKINGRKQAIDTQLRDGDTLEPLFGEESFVERAWLHACKSAVTKKHIRALLSSN